VSSAVELAKKAAVITTKTVNIKKQLDTMMNRLEAAENKPKSCGK